MTPEGIPDGLIDDLVKWANLEAPNEMCGFIMRNGPEKIYLKPCANVAKDPRHHFEIPAEDIVWAYEREQDVVGIYHSHPRGPEGPSEADRKYAPPGKMRYFIVTLTHVYEWERS